MAKMFSKMFKRKLFHFNTGVNTGVNSCVIIIDTESRNDDTGKVIDELLHWVAPTTVSIDLLQGKYAVIIIQCQE